jgi:hypothetical protein
LSLCSSLQNKPLRNCSPEFTVNDGADVYYCPQSKELWATFPYTSKYVSDIFDGVTAFAFTGQNGDVIIPDDTVDCMEYHQGKQAWQL